MRKKLLKLMAVFLICFSVMQLKSQEAVLSSGGSNSSAGGSISYSVGQVVYSGHSGTSGSISEGVQQIFEISTSIETKDANGIYLSLLAFPNPTDENLILKVDLIEFNDLSFHLFDSKGNLLESKRINNQESSILMNNYTPGTYLLKITQTNQNLKIFKIIKN